MQLDAILSSINSLETPEELRKILEKTQIQLKIVMRRRMMSTFSTDNITCTHYESEGVGDEYPGCRDERGNIIQEHHFIFRCDIVSVRITLTYTKECDGMTNPWYTIYIKVHAVYGDVEKQTSLRNNSAFFPDLGAGEDDTPDEEEEELDESEEDIDTDEACILALTPILEEKFDEYRPIVEDCLRIIRKNRNEMYLYR